MASLISYVDSVTDPASPDYVAPEERIAVFDADGTLLGERFPTYFDQCLLMHRLLHDESYEAAPEDKAFAETLETALLNGEKAPKAPRSTAQMLSESFKGYTVEEYRAYVRDFMNEPAAGFEGMTYGEAFFQPMVSVVSYLAGKDFQIFLSSGAERSMLREVTKDALGFETISMRDEFATIYGDNVVMTEFRNENTAAEELSPAA